MAASYPLQRWPVTQEAHYPTLYHLAVASLVTLNFGDRITASAQAQQPEQSRALHQSWTEW